MLAGIIESAVGTIVGALITWFVSQRYYKMAGDQLEQEARSLRRLQELTIYALTHPGANIQPTMDPQGNITGLAVTAMGSAGTRVSMRGELTLGQPPGPSTD